MAILKIAIDSEEISVVLWNSFYANHQISQITEDEILGKFIFIFGTKSLNQESEDQIALSEVGDDILEFL
jgi:hypothetical protein